jgi:hypothetical protein
LLLVRGAGVEPARPFGTTDFKSVPATSYGTRAFLDFLFLPR